MCVCVCVLQSEGTIKGRNHLKETIDLNGFKTNKIFLQYCGYQLKKTRLATEKYNPMDIIIQIIRKHNFFLYNWWK